MLSDSLLSRVNNGAGRIIWAFDPRFEEKDPFSKFKEKFSNIQDTISAVKFNRQFLA